MTPVWIELFRLLAALRATYTEEGVAIYLGSWPTRPSAWPVAHSILSHDQPHREGVDVTGR